ncbi:MAG: hypothetical protein V1885_03310 [Candidatus Brennerbacteria bacterium]
MDELNQNQNQMGTVPSANVPPAMPEPPQQSKFWKFATWFVVIVVVAGVVVWVADYVSPGARSARETQRNYELYQQGINDMEAALRADTYGGATPQETLDLFVDALRKGDIELASKYFELDINTQSEDYLTRRKWEQALEKARSDGKSDYILSVVAIARPDPQAAITEDYFVFSARDENGVVITDLDMRLNKYSGVWKIQSL